MVERNTFPQSGDPDAAADFGQMIGHDVLSDYVITGLNFTYNSSVPEVTVSKGVCAIRRDQATSSFQDGSGNTVTEDRLSVTTMHQLPQVTKSLTDNDVNYVYVEPDFSTDDNSTVEVYTSQTSASSNALLVGTIDTNLADTNPDATDDTLNGSPSFATHGLSVEDDKTLSFGDDSDYTFRYDSSNDHLSIQDQSGSDLLTLTDSDFTFGVPLGSDIDLNGNTLTDLSQDFIDLTGDGNNLRLDTGQSIEDGSGIERITFKSGATEIQNDVGETVFSSFDGGATQLNAFDGQPVRIKDEQSGFTAVQYDTDTSVGLFRTPGAGLRVEDNPSLSSGVGLTFDYDSGNSRATISTYNHDTSSHETTRIFGSNLELHGSDGLVDMSVKPANLRIAKGQAIEDGSGIERVEIASTRTNIRGASGGNFLRVNDGGPVSVTGANLQLDTGQAIEDESGTARVSIGSQRTELKFEDGKEFINASKGGAGALVAYNGTPVNIFDNQGGFNALKYLSSSSSPGTLQLSNADLDMNGNLIDGGDVVNSGSGPYEIQKNGSDTTGVINFKT